MTELDRIYVELRETAEALAFGAELGTQVSRLRQMVTELDRLVTRAAEIEAAETPATGTDP